MKHILAILLFGAVSATAFAGSRAGWGFEKPLDQPVSIRQGSEGGHLRAGLLGYYAGRRTHRGGGFRGGK